MFFESNVFPLADLVWNWPVVAFFVLFSACVLLMVAAVRQAKTRPHPAILLVWALWMIWIVASTTWSRLELQLNGVVTASRDIPPTRGPRYATEYILRGPDGRDQQYVAGATSDSLPRSMPVGTYLKKQRWQLGYERNGQKVDDFGLWFAGLLLCVAAGALRWSFNIWRAGDWS